MDGEATLTRAGEAWVADLTVEEAGHYITAGGLVNKNSWMCFDEAGNWPTPMPIDRLWACVRSPEGIPCFRRLTGNPGGPGHNWVKARYIDVAPALTVFDQVFELGGQTFVIKSVFIPSRLEDNPAAMAADPNYEARVMASGPEWLVKAWRYGDWDIIAGGMFDDVWDRKVHLVKPFAIPASWLLDRSFDWGSSHPFAVCWWAESDGTTYTDAAGRKRTLPNGSLVLIAEWYGWTGKPNVGCGLTSEAIAVGIKEREEAWGILDEVAPGPSDPMIFSEADDNSISGRMEGATDGVVVWERADNSPGSRANGWEAIRTMLVEARKPTPERPVLLFFDTCVQAVRTLPVLQRDVIKVNDIAKGQEDHEPDAIRYRCAYPGNRTHTFHSGI